jgi:carbon starvation protein
MAALALGVVTVYLYTKQIPQYYTLVPMILILCLTIWAMIENIIGFINTGEYLLVLLSVLILTLTGWLMVSSFIALFGKHRFARLTTS